MESLSDTKWDVVISGTGLQQSLLALALSRSGKAILHLDPGEYYGAAEAALSLQEADSWAIQHRDANADGVFTAARASRSDASSSSRMAHTIALAPTLIHARSELLSQLVSSKAFRQIDFLAVGSFFVHSPEGLSRIPSTREDVFSDAAIPAKSKRALIKFLRFVLDYAAEPQVDTWRPHAEKPLSAFLEQEFRLDAELRAYIVTLTLSLDADVSVEAGLAAIHRHMASTGVLGPGFAAVYPKWGGLSEIAQVGCRAAAVGGAVYMLGVGIEHHVPKEDGHLEITLSNGVVVTAKHLVRAEAEHDAPRVSRFTAVVDSPLSPLFDAVVEGAPTPCVAVIAFPTASPVYAMVHSSDTGECPPGQCVIHLCTASSPTSQDNLNDALSSLLATHPATILYRLSYEQACSRAPSLSIDGNMATFNLLPADLAFNDSVLTTVRQSWDFVMEDSQGEGYMVFKDRQGAEDEDEL